MTTTTPMAGWDLFEDLRAAQDEMLQAIRGRGWRPSQHYDASGTAAWAPAVDISERKDAYLVTAELPGVKAGEVEITFEDGLLTIQGLQPDRSARTLLDGGWWPHSADPAAELSSWEWEGGQLHDHEAAPGRPRPAAPARRSRPLLPAAGPR
jgi:hypothetical protein